MTKGVRIWEFMVWAGIRPGLTLCLLLDVRGDGGGGGNDFARFVPVVRQIGAAPMGAGGYRITCVDESGFWAGAGTRNRKQSKDYACLVQFPPVPIDVAES
ncbi:hypothetical protein FPV67DRAFT_1446651 [Lyophyllum atratum]|nr:hypothetical protein FPV67DRAFT_1446651 [Lyophyllum atratum]